VDYTPDEMFRRTDLCAWSFLFSSRYDVPRGVSVLGHGDTKSAGVGCERSHSGAKDGGMSRISAIDYTGGDIVSASIV
jgi:hypothetical protein